MLNKFSVSGCWRLIMIFGCIGFLGHLFSISLALNPPATEPLPNLAERTIIYIENENDKPVGLMINNDRVVDHRPSAGEGQPKKGCIRALVPEKSVVEFEVLKTDLDNAEYFSVTGETNPLTPSGTCHHLKTGHAYKIRFTDKALGTDCISKRLLEPAGTQAHDHQSENNQLTYRKIKITPSESRFVAARAPYMLVE